MFKIKLMSVPLIVAIVVSTFLAGLQVLPVYAAVIYVSGHITTNTTWTAGNVYVIENPVTVDSGVVLTVEAGVIVKFAANKLLAVNGVLKVQGTSSNPVIITSLKDDTAGGDTNGDGNATAPAMGDWGHIVFFDTSVDSETLIEYAVIRYGGYFDNYYYQYYNNCCDKYYSVIRFDSASPTVRNTTITENTNYAFSASVDSFPVITGNTLTLNQGNGLEIRGGTLSAASPIVRHWSNTDVAYAVTGNTTVASGVTLAIDPGVTVKFAANKILGVNGVLKVQGTITNPVIITSLKDDTAGGDTNGDGNATAPAMGDWGHIVFFDTSVDSETLIEYAVIRYGGYFDNYYYQYYNNCCDKYYSVIRFDSASPTVRNTTITENTNYAFSASVDSFPVITGNTLTLNQGNGLEIRGGTLSAASPIVRHWSNTDVAYAVTGNTTVASGVTLAIDPGVTVKFAANKILGVNGVLKVQGTITNPVIITSLKDDTAGGDTNGDGNASAPAVGDWGHIAFLDTSVDSENLIEYAIIRYGGYFDNYYYQYYNNCCTKYYGAINLESASPTIRYSLLTQNTGYALSGSVDSFPVITGNTLTLNQGNGLEIRGGTLSAASPIVRHWSNTDVVYALTDNIVIASGVTLAFDPGVIVKLTPNNLLGVNGVLKVQGTITNPVIITSLKDDTAGGDTNGDGNATAPAVGDWGHIAFLDTSVDSENIIKYATVRYGGYFDNYYYRYYNNCCTKYYGAINLESASPTLVSNTIALNQRGIVSRGSSQPVIQNNLVFGNTEYGAQNENSAVTMDARFNWWGNASGPYHPTANPSGKGNPVSDYINFSPWNASAPAMNGLIRPGTGGAVFSPDGSTSIVYATNAVSEATWVTYTVSSSANPFNLQSIEDVLTLPSGLTDTGHAFNLTARTVSGNPASPIGQVKIQYTANDISNISSESTLSLYRWNGSAWVTVISSVNSIDNVLTASISADGTYAMFGQAVYRIFLPMVRRK